MKTGNLYAEVLLTVLCRRWPHRRLLSNWIEWNAKFEISVSVEYAFLGIHSSSNKTSVM